ncbi:hypothetical protein [Streptomyces sp. NRRL B-24572]|uniref:hypothetical protein n=1 Tax=Streptomyces sp. NRRL B-24572 TaxID=1962156 RepID=UPI000A397EA2|nr:hypothetical protein [Streptomyces sp. NRRL B-24572]
MDASKIARRFPLVARPRPACPPIAERLREITKLADTAERDGDLVQAAVTQNKAALIASDCGLPALARTLCWAHAEVYLQGPRPLSAHAARLALEPLVNLARLRIRASDGEAAYELLSDLFQAVSSRAPEATIDGRNLSLVDLTSSKDDLKKVVQWLWTVLLADGTRALISAGRWKEALRQVEKHNGIGGRLLDGRQVAVLSRLVDGEPEAALALLNTSRFTDSWEEDVASCLTVACLMAVGSGTVDSAVSHMIRRYLDGRIEPGLAVFRTRWGLTVLDLSANAETVSQRLVNETLVAGDGYAARDLVEHSSEHQILTPQTRRALQATAQAAGLLGAPSSHTAASLRADTTRARAVTEQSHTSPGAR